MLTIRQFFGFLKSGNASETTALETAALMQRMEDSTERSQAILMDQAWQAIQVATPGALFTAFLPLSFFTSVCYLLSTLWVSSNKKPYQYFGMNNIKEFNGNPISRVYFWSTTAPVTAGVMVLTVMIILWGRPWMVRWRSLAREKFRTGMTISWRTELEPLALDLPVRGSLWWAEDPVLPPRTPRTPQTTYESGTGSLGQPGSGQARSGWEVRGLGRAETPRW